MHGVTSLEGQLSRAPGLEIYLRTYLRVSFPRSGVNSLRACTALVFHERTRILWVQPDSVWTAVILNNKETIGPVLIDRILKMYSI